jgi:hypothetical protein
MDSYSIDMVNPSDRALGFDIYRVGEKIKIGECSLLPTQRISYPSSI